MTQASEVIKFLDSKMSIEPNSVNTKAKESKRFLDANQIMMIEIQDPQLVAVLRGFKSPEKMPKITMPKDGTVKVSLSIEYVKSILDLCSKLESTFVNVHVAHGKPVKFEVPRKINFYLSQRIDKEPPKAPVGEKEEKIEEEENKEERR